jgi:membrane-associated phospholipid phosphatase
MDAIESLDWGVYAHFRFQGQQYPAVFPLMQIAYYLSSYVGVSVGLAIAVILFLVQGKRRSALVALVSFASAFGLVDVIRFLVPRRRPEDAENWLGPDAMLGSYPSAGVFLFMLAMILIGFAMWDLARPWLRGAYVLIAALLTAWVCLSQFFLAIHFLTDVLGGMAGAALIAWIAHRYLDPKGPRPQEGRDTAPVSAVSSDAIQDLSRSQGIQRK